jgi:hypothetical protein
MVVRPTDRFMAMKGQGYYSKATTGAKDVIDGAAHLVIEAIDRMDLADDGQAIRLVDMGAADGGTSIDLWRRVLKHIRAKVPSWPIELVYTDLPRNDFSQLFRIVHGQTDIPTYLNEVDDVFVFASANSFHRPIFPPRSLSLGFSSTASHYISKVPCEIAKHLHMVGADEAERRAFAEQGACDWETMLLARARELVPGGRLCLFNFGIDEEGRYLGNTGGVSMFDTYDAIWAELVREGRISEAEYRATNFPQHYRTVAEFTQPFKDMNSPVFRAGLRLEHVETRVVRCPYARDFEAHRDPRKFAHEYIPTLRSWSEPVFANGLSASRAPEEKASIIDEFYSRYEERVAASPEGHGMDYVHIYLVIRKEG